MKFYNLITMTDIDWPSFIASYLATEYVFDKRVVLSQAFICWFDKIPIYQRTRDATMFLSTLFQTTTPKQEGALHKPRIFKIAKMWGLFINREKSNFAKFKTAKFKE